jgi:hypothetical protein
MSAERRHQDLVPGFEVPLEKELKNLGECVISKLERIELWQKIAPRGYSRLKQ